MSNQEQPQLSYIRRFNLMAGSALEEAECFVASLKALQSSFNQSNDLPALEKDLKETMDQYTRLTMVCDVLKMFNPFTLPSSSASSSPAPQVPANTTPSSHPLVKMEDVDIKPAHLIGASSPFPLPQNTPVRNAADPTFSAPSVSPQVATTINQNNFAATHASQVQHNNQQQQVTPASIINNNIQATSNTNTNHVVTAAAPNSTLSSSRPMPNFGTNSNRTELKATRTSNSTVEEKEILSTTHFIKTFEAILKYFTNTNKLHVDDTWEKLFIHSLPPQQKGWFTSNLQGKSYSWERAKNLFFQEFDRIPTGINKNKMNSIADGDIEGGSAKKRRKT